LSTIRHNLPYGFPAGDEPTLRSASDEIEGLNVSAEQTQPIGESAAKISDPAGAKIKGAMSVNPVKKANGGPPTPTVKKVTFSNVWVDATTTNQLFPDHQLWYIWRSVRETNWQQTWVSSTYYRRLESNSAATEEADNVCPSSKLQTFDGLCVLQASYRSYGFEP